MSRRPGPTRRELLRGAAWSSAWLVGARLAWAAGDLRLHAELPRSAVKLGDAVEVSVSVHNDGARAVELPRLRLADDAVSLWVTPEDGPPAEVTRRYGVYERREDDLVFERLPTRVESLGPGAVRRGKVVFAAPAVGEFTLRARLGEGADALESEAVRLRIQSRGGGRMLPATIDTSVGSFRAEFDGARAFNTVAHLWQLAQEGFFDGLAFHRVLPGVLAQTGDPRGDGTGTPGWWLPLETPVYGFPLGEIGLARGVPRHSGGSQWFVSLDERPDGHPAYREGFTRIGRVVEGIDVVKRLADVELEPGSQRPVEPPRLLRMRTVGR